MGQTPSASYFHFAVVASHRLAVIVSLVTQDAETLSVNDKLGGVISIFMSFAEANVE